MGIFRVIGLGLAIIILSILMPEVFSALEEVLLKLFRLLGAMLSFSEYTFINEGILPASPHMR